MGLSGRVGAGAASGLAEMLARQLEEAQLAERVRAQQAQEGMQRDRLSFDRERFTADQDARQQDIEQESIEGLRKNNDRMDARLTRLQGEQDAMDKDAAIQKILETLTPQQRAIQQLGGKLSMNDLKTPEQLKAEADSEVEQVRREAEARAAAEAKYRPAPVKAEPKPPAPVDTSYNDTKNSQALNAAKKLRDKVSVWTAGAGSMLSSIPATDARNFKAELQTLKSNIAFNELAQMRAASKTGGALGAVSDKESALLESALGALDQGQSPDQLRAQLDQIVNSLSNYEAAKSLGGVPGNNAPAKKFTIVGVK